MHGRLQNAILVCLIGLASTANAAKLSWLEQAPLESYGKMREVERYQLQIAEKHYLKEEYKIALDEYEKFLTLYEASTGAPYAQLMWSHCQLKLRKVNTAIREGFQSVIDYWPNSQEAVMASFLIGKSFQDIGEIEKAKASYKELMEAHPNGPIPVLAKVNLLEMAKTAKNEEAALQILEDLTFETQRTDATKGHCESASRELSKYYFNRGDFENANRSLSTTYEGNQLLHHIYEYGRAGVIHLRHKEETKEKGASLGGQIISTLEDALPSELGEEQESNRRTAWDHLNRIAAIHGSLGEPDKVLKTYERMGKLLGESDRLRGQIASHYRSIKEREKAKQIYQQYEIQKDGLKHIAYMLREEGKLDDAIKMYRELIQAHPDGINDYLWAIAECYEGKKDWKNAIQSYRQCDRYPQNYFRMAQCHRNSKQWKEAITLYNQAKASESSAPEAMVQIAYTYELGGQRENAIKAFQATCRAYPKSGQASRAHAHLQNKYEINMTLGGGKDD